MHAYFFNTHFTQEISAPSTFREVPRCGAFGLRRGPAADLRGARGGADRGEQAPWPLWNRRGRPGNGRKTIGEPWENGKP